MLTKLQNDWKGTVDINGVHYDSVRDAVNAFKNTSDEVHIVLHSARQTASKSVTEVNSSTSVTSSVETKITVKKYMTQKSTPEFDFMAKFNNDNPMPMRIMQGTVEKETRGMVFMKLHGMGYPTITCSCCGKPLTNPVSRHYGVGPICLSKMGIVTDISEVEAIKEQLARVEWSGWVIKSAITESEEVK